MHSVEEHLRRHWRRYARAGGVTAIVVSILFVFPMPGVLEMGSMEAVAAPLVALAGVVAAVFVLGFLVVPAEPVERTPPRDRTASNAKAVGWGTEATLALVDGPGGGGVEGYRNRMARKDLRSDLQGAVMETLLARGYDPWEARQVLEDGEWTDDPRAARYLSWEAPPVPLRTRVEDWANGDGERRRAEHAVRAVADFVTGEGEI